MKDSNGREYMDRNYASMRLMAALSQARLAERMGIDRAYVSGLELGQRNPTIVTLWHVGKALGVRPRQFFDEDSTWGHWAPARRC